MKKILFAGTAMVFGLVITGCAGQPNQPLTLDEKLAKKGFSDRHEVKSIQNFQIKGWHRLDNNAITVEASRKRDYLITFTHSCQGLRGSPVIAIDSDAGRVSRFNDIIVRIAPKMHERCRIDRIYELVKAEAE